LLVDDVFLMLGSANLNLRSMAVDSEINIATNNPYLARDLRRRIFAQHSGNDVDGGSGSKNDIKETFRKWMKLMKNNRAKKIEDSQSEKRKKMTGFLLPLSDNRSSFIRLG